MDPLEALGEHVRAVHLQDRPFVTLSYAQSLDGSLAARPGARLQLSGPESTALTHRLRAAHDAVLVGIGTVLADDPQLTVRFSSGASPRPVVLDSQLRTPTGAALLRHPQPPWIAGLASPNGERAAALRRAGAEVLALPADSQGLVSLAALLQESRRRGVSRLMVEGGARVIRSFLSARLVDWILIAIAPRFVGGLPALQLDPVEAERGPRLRDPHWQTLGEDLIVWGGLS